MSSKLSFPRWIAANVYFRVSIVVLLCFIALALGTTGFFNVGGVAASHDEASQVLTGQKVSLIFDPVVAGAAAQSQNKPVPSVQSGHEWDGIVLVPDPLERTGSYDFHEFDVLANFDNDSMQVGITWDAGSALAYDLDLYIDRLIDGVWTPVGQSTNGRATGVGDPAEGLSMPSPIPGRYRTRVHNWASTQIMYHGKVGFTSDGIITKQRKVKTVGGRATEDRPDTTTLV